MMDCAFSIMREVMVDWVPDMTSSFFHTTRPSMPPSTLRHSPEMCPAARWLARNTIARATSSGFAILRSGTVAWASVHNSSGSSSRPSMRGVSTQPGATAFILALLFKRTISFFTPRTRPYWRPALPDAYSVCPAWPNLPVSDPVTTIARFSSSLPVEIWTSSALSKKCFIVRNVPRMLVL